MNESPTFVTGLQNLRKQGASFFVSIQTVISPQILSTSKQLDSFSGSCLFRRYIC